MKQPLWSPTEDQIKSANLTRFRESVNRQYGQALATYAELYQWSIDNREDFWAAMWEFGGVVSSKGYTQVGADLDRMPGAKWFLGAELNFAENLLRYRDDHPALIFHTENELRMEFSYAELYTEVCKAARALREAGVTTGDRVAGFMPNLPQTIIAMLATSSLGAVWSSCSPDFGIQGVFDRFGQIQPKVLFTANGYFYNGRAHDSLERVAGILDKIPEIEKVVVVPYTEENPDLSGLDRAVAWPDFLSGDAPEIEFAQLPFDHPLFIMYSSGTTGLPKCMIHGAGGTLIQHLKEHQLQTDLKREDRLFYFTTCGWMMWNWLVSGLATGATLLLFDGSPFSPGPEVLWQMAEDEGMTIFGTSAKYLAALQNTGLRPKDKFDLAKIRIMTSTGSPLAPEQFDWVYEAISDTLCLSSISGGTDIISCFALGAPTEPVYRGELQVRGLGMAVQAYDPQGLPAIQEKGELVCVKSFPSMPVGFWNDPDGAKYHSAYFDTYENIWHHGDYVEITDTGGVIMYGRSDATLNPGGVRIGTAEIYRVVEHMEEIADSLVIGQDWEGDTRVLLFVIPAEGYELNDDLIAKIKTSIRSQCTPRHVPAKVLRVEDIPYTISGKKVELAVRKVIHGEEVTNKDALANPTALDLYDDLGELKE